MKYIKTYENFNLNEGKEFNYMMLDRLRQDCEYFLNWGNGNVKHLYYGNIEEHIAEMKKLWNNFPENEKPEWLSYEDIENYEKEMINYQKNPTK